MAVQVDRLSDDALVLAERPPPKFADILAMAAMPPEQPLAMPTQSLSRFDSKSRRRWVLPRNAHSPWLARCVVFGGALAVTAYGTEQMYRVVDIGGVTLLEWL